MDPVKGARKGRESAFLRLFDEHHQPLFRFAYRLTGSVADAEDIVQECFLELMRPECKYDSSRTPVRTYLFGVVRNQWLMRLRNKEGLGKSEIEVKVDRSPEALLLQGELRDVVARAISQLPSTQKEVLIMAHYEQMPLAGIADVVGVEVTAVKSRLQRARENLKEILGAYVPELERTDD
jgi:RNA polymerase sigma-70 factor (ECF subfamily)